MTTLANQPPRQTGAGMTVLSRHYIGPAANRPNDSSELGDATAGIGYFRPISFSNSFSVSTGMPSSRALSSLLPGFSPAMT
jgi:hypothetical protein